jgi:hypothetical protein
MHFSAYMKLQSRRLTTSAPPYAEAYGHLRCLEAQDWDLVSRLGSG